MVCVCGHNKKEHQDVLVGRDYGFRSLCREVSCTCESYMNKVFWNTSK